jgi:hypothetical protein
LKSFPDNINMLGDVVEQRNFSGVFERLTVVLFRVPEWANQAAGTHFAALLDPYEVRTMATQTEAEAREDFNYLVGEVFAEQARQFALAAQIAAQATLH